MRLNVGEEEEEKDECVDEGGWMDGGMEERRRRRGREAKEKTVLFFGFRKFWNGENDSSDIIWAFFLFDGIVDKLISNCIK